MPHAITRRSFVRGAGALGAGLVLPGLTGCGKRRARSDMSPTTLRKILRFGQGNAHEVLDMQTAANTLTATISDCVCEPLLKWDQDNQLEPCLLTSVPRFEHDGVTLHCNLKEGVQFQDGTELTAEDVKYTFERMFRPDTQARRAYLYTHIAGANEMLSERGDSLDEGITIEDDTHFTFHLTSPFAPFIPRLGLPCAQIFPEDVCEQAGDDWGDGTNFLGTGKYYLVSNDEDEVVLEPNGYYHEGEPLLDEIHIVFFEDSSDKLKAFQYGQIDYCDLPTELLTQYQDDKDVGPLITPYDTLGVQLVNLNLSDTMGLTNSRIRQALSLAIDRQTIVDTVAAGSGTVCSGWLPPSIPGYDSSAPAFAYDPDRARQLLEQEGATSLHLTSRVRKGINQQQLSQIQSMWRDVGVDLDMRVVDNGAWASDVADGTLQVTTLGWYASYPSADDLMYSYFYANNAAKRSSFYNNPQFDALVTQARTTMNPAEQARLYQKADNILTRQDYATLPLYWPQNQFVVHDYVLNAKVANLTYHLEDLDIDTTKADYSDGVPE